MNYEMIHPSSVILHPLLPHLWLHEPDAETGARAARELNLPLAEPGELASAYADVFLLNVYPYGAAFTDPFGELNGPEAQWAAALYEAHGYCPPELDSVGAPDHLGLCLGFLAVGQDAILPRLLDWAPVCCLAVEREPSAHPFYIALAAHTREWLMAYSLSRIADSDKPSAIGHRPSAISHPRYAIRETPFADDEVGLRDIVHFFLAPAQCGLFLSRARLGQMAKALGMRLPFGSRFDVAGRLFAAAGEAGQVEQLLGTLGAEVEAWGAAYRRWAAQYPMWRPIADVWLARAANAARTLAEMRQIMAA